MQDMQNIAAEPVGMHTRIWIRLIIDPQFGATGSRKVMSTAMPRQCHEIGVRPDTVAFHFVHTHTQNRGQEKWS